MVVKILQYSLFQISKLISVNHIWFTIGFYNDIDSSAELLLTMSMRSLNFFKNVLTWVSTEHMPFLFLQDRLIFSSFRQSQSWKKCPACLVGHKVVGI
jgi:hypothetical protein